MEETRVSTEQSYLRDALSRGDGYYKRVKIGGKYYTAMMVRGGDVTRFPAQTPESTRKAHEYSEMFFEAHKTAYTVGTGDSLSDQSITHIDVEGIKDEEGLIQSHSQVGLSDAQKDHLMAEFDSEKDAIVQQYTLDRPNPVAKDAVPSQFRAYLPEREDGQYDKAAIKVAIDRYTHSRFNRIMDVVVSSNPECKERLNTKLLNIVRDNPNEGDYKNLLDESCAALKQHMTAQTVWKAMMNVLLPDQLIYVTDTEENKLLLVPDSEDLPSEEDKSGFFVNLPAHPLIGGKDRLGEVERREFPEDSLGSLEEEDTPKPTKKETWGAMFSRWGTNTYSYVPSPTSIPLVGRLFSGSSTASHLEKEVELKPVHHPIVSFEDELSRRSREEDSFLDEGYSSGEEEVSFELPELHSVRKSVHEHEEIPVHPVTAQEVFSELSIVAQRAPKDDISASRKQDAAKTALAKIEAKLEKKEDIPAFTEDEQWVINEAIPRNTLFSRRPYNSQFLAIRRRLRSISDGH